MRVHLVSGSRRGRRRRQLHGAARVEQSRRGLRLRSVTRLLQDSVVWSRAESRPHHAHVGQERSMALQTLSPCAHALPGAAWILTTSATRSAPDTFPAAPTIPFTHTSAKLLPFGR